MEGKYTKIGTMFTAIGVLIAVGFGMKQIYDSALSSAIQEESLRLEQITNQKLTEANEKLEKANNELIRANEERAKANEELKKANRELIRTRKEIENAKNESLKEIYDTKNKIEKSKKDSEKAINDSEFRIQIGNQKDREESWRKRLKTKRIFKRYDDIKLENRCNKSIDVAVRYVDLENNWVTEGWWKVKPGETVLTSIDSRGKYIYFYAKSGNMEWDGEGESNSVYQYIVSNNFVKLYGYDLYGENKKAVYFSRSKIGSQFKVFTQTFSCN